VLHHGGVKTVHRAVFGRALLVQTGVVDARPARHHAAQKTGTDKQPSQTSFSSAPSGVICGLSRTVLATCGRPGWRGFTAVMSKIASCNFTPIFEAARAAPFRASRVSCMSAINACRSGVLTVNEDSAMRGKRTSSILRVSRTLEPIRRTLG
jgi:hypothetical protein